MPTLVTSYSSSQKRRRKRLREKLHNKEIQTCLRRRRRRALRALPSAGDAGLSLNRRPHRCRQPKLDTSTARWASSSADFASLPRTIPLRLQHPSAVARSLPSLCGGSWCEVDVSGYCGNRDYEDQWLEDRMRLLHRAFSISGGASERTHNSGYTVADALRLSKEFAGHVHYLSFLWAPMGRPPMGAHGISWDIV